jgi:cytochrome c oxidase cbb3-type subunit 3
MFSKYKNQTLLGLFLAAMPAVAMAQDTAGDLDRELIMLLMYTAIIVAVVCLLLVVTVFFMLRQQAASATSSQTAADGAESAAAQRRPSAWSKFMKGMTAAVPVAREADIDMGHEYDGIRELDNRLPPWWLYGFYATIVIAIGYMWYFHISSDWTSTSQYEEEVQIAEVKKAEFLKEMALLVDETNVTMLTDASALASGKKTFENLCVACHAADGGGGIGPNLTDNYWLHGGSIQDIFKTVKYGVPEKGMISWQDQLNPVEMHEVSSYIKTLVGTTPAVPKDPQGDLWEEGPEEPADGAEPAEGGAAEADEMAVSN